MWGGRGIWRRRNSAQERVEDGFRGGAGGDGEDFVGAAGADDGDGLFGAESEAGDFDDAEGAAAAGLFEGGAEGLLEGVAAFVAEAAVELVAALLADEGDSAPGGRGGDHRRSLTLMATLQPALMTADMRR